MGWSQDRGKQGNERHRLIPLCSAIDFVPGPHVFMLDTRLSQEV